MELNEGKDSEIEQVQWHQLRWPREAVRRLPPTVPATVHHAEQVSHESGNGSLDMEQSSKDRLVNLEVDETQVNGVRDTGDHHRQQQQRSEHVTNFSSVVNSTGRVSQSEFQGRRENSDSNFPVLLSSSSNDCRIQELRPLTDSSSEDDFTKKASLSSAASFPSSQKLLSLVGCRVSPGQYFVRGLTLFSRVVASAT